MPSRESVSRLALIAATAAILVAPAGAQQQTLDDATVASALEAGLDEDAYEDLVDLCTAAPGFGESLGRALVDTGGAQPTGRYTVTVMAHLGQIATLNAERQRKYMPPMEPAAVPEDIRVPKVYVWIEPEVDNDFDGTLDVAAIIDHVVVRPEDRPEHTIQPETLSFDPVTFSNLLGGEWTANQAVATFPAADVRAVVDEHDRDLEIVVITDAGERRCDIGKDDVRRIFGEGDR